MGYDDGWAAVNLKMPGRVPRFDPSAGYHHELLKTVTGMDVSPDSPGELYLERMEAFVKAWDFGILFACAVGYNVLEKKRTRMGHAVYAGDGSDFDTNVQCPFRGPEEVLSFDPFDVYGEPDEEALLRKFNDQYRGQCESFPDAVNMTGIYTTLMSGMIAIFGWDLLLTAAGLDPDGFGEVVNRYARWMQRHYDALARSDTVVIYSHDDMVWTEGAFIHPGWYRKYIFPNLKKLWAPLVEAGKKVMFVCDGNYTEFLDDIVACGNAGFWFECFTDLDEVCRRFGKTHFIIGNADARVLTFGTKDQVRAEVERCMRAGKPCPGYFMCLSGHLAPNIPVENALHYHDVYMELRER